MHREAPPFFVLHGEKDELVPSGQARAFCAALRGAGAATVSYAELANAHHAFDIISTVRSRLAANAVADFLGVDLRPAACRLTNGFIAAVGFSSQLNRLEPAARHHVSWAVLRRPSR